MTKQEIRQRVEELTSRHDTRDPFLLCRRMGVEIVFAPLTRRVRGFYQRLYGTDVIYLSDGLREGEQRVILAHELGHCVLHKGLNSFFITRSTLYPVGRFEGEADEFARCLLEGSEQDIFCADEQVKKILFN